MAAVSSSPPRRTTWYRARKPLPAIALIIALCAVAGLVWVSVLNRPELTSGGCRQAAEAVARESGASPRITPGQRLAHADLEGVAPAPPQFVTVQVLNANGQRGEAGIVASALTDLGFVPTGEPTNDPVHPQFDLLCHGEIRFGAAGEAAARTLSLAMPCAELVRDVRPDAVVDLALGTEFSGLNPTDAGKQALSALARQAQGGQAAEHAPPPVDPGLLRAALDASC